MPDSALGRLRCNVASFDDREILNTVVTVYDLRDKLLKLLLQRNNCNTVTKSVQKNTDRRKTSYMLIKFINMVVVVWKNASKVHK